MTPHGFTNLGGKDKPVDTRDIKLGAAAPISYTFPKEINNLSALTAAVEYQRQQPACGAYSGAALRGMVDACRYTPRYTWADIKTFDGMPIEWGTDIRSIFKSITKQGTLEFPLLGDESTLPLPQYVLPKITSAMRENASRHNGKGYGFITDKTFKGIKQFIADNGPSIMLMRVGSEMWTAPNGQASWQEKDILPLRPPKQIVSGHFVVIHSYDEKRIYFLNSWSDEWGRKGHGYFEEDYMPFINDVGGLFNLAFTHDLQFGMTEPDVQRLQAALNKNPATQVATTGPGSPGNETNYFGGLTLAAVKKYQVLKGITPVSGYVGPLTRAKLNGV